MELRHQLSVLRSWFWILIASVLLAGGTAYLVSTALPKVYEGKVTLIVGQSLNSANPDINQLLASQRLSQTYADLATTTPILQEVIAQNGVTITPDDLRKLVSADAPRDSTLVHLVVHLVVQDGDASRSADFRNTAASQGLAVRAGTATLQTTLSQDLVRSMPGVPLSGLRSSQQPALRVACPCVDT